MTWDLRQSENDRRFVCRLRWWVALLDRGFDAGKRFHHKNNVSKFQKMIQRKFWNSNLTIKKFDLQTLPRKKCVFFYFVSLMSRSVERFPTIECWYRCTRRPPALFALMNGFPCITENDKTQQIISKIYKNELSLNAQAHSLCSKRASRTANRNGKKDEKPLIYHMLKNKPFFFVKSSPRVYWLRAKFLLPFRRTQSTILRSERELVNCHTTTLFWIFHEKNILKIAHFTWLIRGQMHFWLSDTWILRKTCLNWSQDMQMRNNKNKGNLEDGRPRM